MSWLRRYFALEKEKTSLFREILAGFSSFTTLVYAAILIPTLLAQAGIDFGAALVATALVSCFCCLLMGWLGNYPFLQAPSLTLCAYFTYSAVQGEGYPPAIMLGSVFLAGCVLFILTITGIRKKILLAIPLSLRLAVTGGLGLFLAMIGLKNAGIIVAHPTTLLSLGDPQDLKHLIVAAGLLATVLLYVFRIPAALFLGTVVGWLVAWALGVSTWKGFVAWPPSLVPTWGMLDVRGALDPAYLGVGLSFLFLLLFDTAGGCLALSEEGGFIQRKEKGIVIPRLTRTLLPDSLGTMLAPILGTGGITFYLESAVGIRAGGRTGIVALVGAACFLLLLFFVPFAASIPIVATTPPLLLVGGMMTRHVGALSWEDPTEWMPAFLTFILIPLTSSVAQGLGIGYITYCLLKLLAAKGRQVHWISWLLAALFLWKIYF